MKRRRTKGPTYSTFFAYLLTFIMELFSLGPFVPSSFRPFVQKNQHCCSSQGRRTKMLISALYQGGCSVTLEQKKHNRRISTRIIMTSLSRLPIYLHINLCLVSKISTSYIELLCYFFLYKILS